MDNSKLTHINENGDAIMVDISEKKPTVRTAVTTGYIRVSPGVVASIIEESNAKGDVLAAARIAGIMAAKQTSSLIPLCHPLPMTNCSIDLKVMPDRIIAVCTAKTEGKTGVEMEALVGVSTALLTIYDMCKAIDKAMVIEDIHLVTKTGGKSGDFVFPNKKEN